MKKYESKENQIKEKGKEQSNRGDGESMSLSSGNETSLDDIEGERRKIIDNAFQIHQQMANGRQPVRFTEHESHCSIAGQAPGWFDFKDIEHPHVQVPLPVKTKNKKNS